MDDGDLKARWDLAIASARQAGARTLHYFNRPDLVVEHKKDGTPVTLADREAEMLLRSQIESAFPQDAILGEELPDRPGTSGFRWILDPIDGTKSFIHGVPLYGTLVGVEYEDRCVIGVILLPATGECVYAARGAGAWYTRGGGGPCRAKVSAVDRLEDALFCSTSVSEFHKKNRQEVYEQLRTRCRLARGWGDCYGYMLVATGRAEIMIDPALSLWDMAALPAILEEAGGTFTDFNGHATIHSSEGIATNGRLLPQVLEVTRGK